MMKIALAIFDMAGTTVEDKDFVHQALIEAMAGENITITRDEANDVMGYPKPVAIQMLLEQQLERTEQITNNYIDHIHRSFVDNMVTFYKSDIRVKAKPGVEETFHTLRHEGIAVAIDTGFCRKIADTIIERLGWNDSLIDYSVTSDEVERGRPHPDMIYKLMELAGVKSPELVMKVGDTVSDLQQGQNADCKYIVGVTTGACTVEQLTAHKHTHLVSHLPEILDILNLTPHNTMI